MDIYRIWKVCVQGGLGRPLALSGTSYKWLSHRGVHPSSGPIIQFPKEDKFCSILATTCLPHISSSTVWMSVKFGIPGKLFSRRIQRSILRRTRITTYGKRRQLPKLRHSDHSGDIWSMSHPDSSYLYVPPSALDVLLQFGTDLGEVWVILEQKYDFHS